MSGNESSLVHEVPENARETWAVSRSSGPGVRLSEPRKWAGSKLVGYVVRDSVGRPPQYLVGVGRNVVGHRAWQCWSWVVGRKGRVVSVGGAGVGVRGPQLYRYPCPYPDPTPTSMPILTLTLTLSLV